MPRAVTIVLGLALVGTVGVPGMAAATGTPDFPSACRPGRTRVRRARHHQPERHGVGGGRPVAAGPRRRLRAPRRRDQRLQRHRHQRRPRRHSTPSPSTARACAPFTRAPASRRTSTGPPATRARARPSARRTASNGTVNFSGGITPGNGTYFSLSGSPITVTSVALQPGTDVTATPICTGRTGALQRRGGHVLRRDLRRPGRPLHGHGGLG